MTLPLRGEVFAFMGYNGAGKGIDEVRANVSTHEEFGQALEEAKRAGVEVLCLGCRVTEDMLEVDRVL